MLSRRCVNLIRKFLNTERCFHISNIKYEKFENPIHRTFRILGEDITRVFRKPTDAALLGPEHIFPRHTDIVIIGGGAVGSSIAYWIKEKTGGGVDVVVIEKDPTYRENSTVLSLGGLRQQFSLQENIQMSLFGAEFLRTIKQRFGPTAEIFFQPYGYLLLANEKSAQVLIENSKFQNELGATNTILSKNALKERFPWLNVDDLEVGCLGLEKEGWFDPWALLQLLKQGAKEFGTRYVAGKAVEFSFANRQDIIIDGVMEGSYEAIDELIVELPNGERKFIRFCICIIAAGADSGDVARLCKIGEGTGMLSIPLPVEKRKRYVYCFDCQDKGPGLNTPMTIDCSGAYFRRDGLAGRYLAGISPTPEEEPPTTDLEVDHQYFDDKLWPLLANRVPTFNGIKVKSAWSGFYDYNMYDENGIVGPHPYYHNLYIATGFSGHGIQQAPAVGRAVAEMILDGEFQTIDLTRLGFDRLMVRKPIYEVCII